MQNIDKFLRWLDVNQWLNLIFLILAILGIVVSIYLYVKSKRKKMPLYSKRSINVISDKFNNFANVDVSYQGKKINNLTVTKIVVWNNGNETINFLDLAATDKLRIETHEFITLFSAEVIYQTNSTNNFKAKIENNIIIVEFDYLDQYQGCIIKIIHSGKGSYDLQVKGTFKGVGEIKKFQYSIYDMITTGSGIFITILGISYDKSLFRLIFKIFPWIVFVMGIILFIAYFIQQPDSSDRIPLTILGSIFLLFGIGMIFKKNRLPTNFKEFYDDE